MPYAVTHVQNVYVRY